MLKDISLSHMHSLSPFPCFISEPTRITYFSFVNFSIFHNQCSLFSPLIPFTFCLHQHTSLPDFWSDMWRSIGSSAYLGHFINDRTLGLGEPTLSTLLLSTPHPAHYPLGKKKSSLLVSHQVIMKRIKWCEFLNQFHAERISKPYRKRILRELIHYLAWTFLRIHQAGRDTQHCQQKYAICQWINKTMSFSYDTFSNTNYQRLCIEWHQHLQLSGMLHLQKDNIK